MNDLATSVAPAPLTSAPMPTPAPTPSPALAAARLLDHEGLADRIAEMLAGTYHCGRVWSAWEIGTMTADDFTDLSETEVPGDIATMILELVAPIAQEAANWRHLRNMPADRIGKVGQISLAMRIEGNAGAYLYGTVADKAVAESIEAERMRVTAILDPSL